MGAQGIRIPVSLELNNLQGEVKRMQSMLEQVSKTSTSFPGLSKAIQKIEQELIGLKTRANQTFTNSAGIKAFEKDFEKVGLSMQNVYATFQNLKPQDLNLIDSAKIQSQMKEVESAIANVQTKIASRSDAELFKMIDPSSIEVLKDLDQYFNIDTSSLEGSLNLVKK